MGVGRSGSVVVGRKVGRGAVGGEGTEVGGWVELVDEAGAVVEVVLDGATVVVERRVRSVVDLDTPQAPNVRPTTEMSRRMQRWRRMPLRRPV